MHNTPCHPFLAGDGKAMHGVRDSYRYGRKMLALGVGSVVNT